MNDYLILETGDKFTLEDGSGSILLELHYKLDVAMTDACVDLVSASEAALGRVSLSDNTRG